MILRIIFCFFLPVSTPLFAQTVYKGLPLTTHYSPQVYQGGIQNWQITQDQRGLLYIANNLGLLEFDGYDWQLYPLPNGGKVRSVAVGQKGHIYVAGQNELGYFFPDSLGTLRYHSISTQLSSNYADFGEAWGIYLDRLGTVYFCTFRYIFELKNERLYTIDTQKQIEFSFLLQNELYINVPQNGLFLLKNKQLNEIPSGDFFADKRISCIVPLKQDQFLITTFEHGAFVYEKGEIRQWELNLQGKILKRLNYALRLHDGRIAIGTQTDGLIVANRNGEINLHMTLGKGLNSRTVLSLFQDRAQNLWVGLNNGIDYLELASPFSLLNEAAGLQGTGYTAYLQGNNLYLGTNSGIYRYSHQKGITNYEPLANGNGLQTYVIDQIGGELLFGTHQGAYTLRNNQIEQISAQMGIWNFIKLPENPNLLLSGTYNGFIYYEKENGYWAEKGKVEGLKESSRVVLATPDHIWMTHGYKGAFRLRFETEKPRFSEVAFYNQQNGFPSDHFINVFNIQNRPLFTSQKGIYQYDPQNKKIILSQYYNKLIGKDRHIRFLEEDTEGNLYFIDANFEVGKITFDEHKKGIIETTLFRKIKGHLNDDLESIISLDYENVLIPAKEGFVHYSPTQTFDTKRPFGVMMRKVLSFGDSTQLLFGGGFSFKDSLLPEQPKEKIPKLPYSQNALRFTYAATFFEGLNQLEYQYRLEGFEREWSAWESKNFKDYTNLPRGNYTFCVRAKNMYGNVSPMAKYRFAIAAPWYASTFAYILYALLLISAYIFALLFLQRKHKKEKKEIITAQAEVLQAKEQELETVSRESEETINQLKDEKLKAEIEHQNEELATATMLLVNKNSFITHIKQHLADIIEKKAEGKQAVADKDLEKMIKEIDKHLAQNNEWEQFQYHFDRVDGDFLHRLSEKFPDLTPQERKLATYLRLNMSSKEVAALMNISVRGVEISRYRLRKKLNLETGDNLTEFILNF